MPPGLSKLATWLFVVAYLVLGVVPARGVVVCFEADGSASLELASAACTECPELEGPPALDVEHDGDDEHEGDRSSCPCIDVPLSLAGADLHSKPRLCGSSDVSAGPIGAAPLARALVALAPPVLVALVAEGPPRPPSRLAELRTVVLRV